MNFDIDINNFFLSDVTQREEKDRPQNWDKISVTQPKNHQYPAFIKNIQKKKKPIEKLVNDTNRNLKEEIQMSNKHIKLYNQRNIN